MKEITQRLRLLVTLLTLIYFSAVQGQVTIFSEDFETATAPATQASPYIGWQNGSFPTNPTTTDNFWWVFDNTYHTVISGNYSMAVSENSPTAAPGTFPQYRTNRRASTIVYYATPIDATNYTTLTLDFNWICEGEAGDDFGAVAYSFDGTTWAALPGTYQGQNTVQNVTNLDLSVLDGQIFYLGFTWENDNNGGASPGMMIDDIDLKGIQLPACTTPNQPTVLNLTPTGDTINGSFTAAVPTPDNYLVCISTSAIAPTPVNTTTYTIGQTIGTATVVDIDANTNFTATGLTPLTLYYIYVFSYNDACVGGPVYNTVTPLTGNTTTTSSVYCTPLTSSNINTKYIDDVEFIGTLNDVTNLNNGTSTTSNGYSDFTGLTNSIQAQGEGVNIYVESSTGRGRYKAWVDWDKDGTFDNTTEVVYDSGNILTTTTTFGFVIPSNQAIGDYRIRIRFHNRLRNNGVELGSYDFTACETFGPSGGRADYGEAEDYLFTVIESCSAQLTSITDGSSCGAGAVTLTATSVNAGDTFNWYDAETGGNLVATTSAGSWSPIVSTTTDYWVTADNGSCESLVRTKVTATINPITTLSISPATPIVCGENDVIELSASGSTELAYLIDDDFETGGTGVFTVVNYDGNGAASNALSEWQNRTSTFVPSEQVWFPAISSGFGTNQFVMATSDINPPSGTVWTSMESPVLDSSTFTDLTLTFDMYFSKYLSGLDPDDVYVFVSTDGGANWVAEQNYDDDVGYGTNFSSISIDLSAYVNETNLMISFDYYAIWADGVAIDNVKLFGNRPLTPSFTWSAGVDAYTDAGATIPYVAGTPITGSVYIKPSLTQLEQASFTITANAALTNGCTISKDITIQNNTRIWNGSTDVNWHDASNWRPMVVPTSDNCVIIASQVDVVPPPPTPTGYDAYAKNVTVKSTGDLTIKEANNLTVTDWIDINAGGLFEVEDAANFIQITNVVTNQNSGDMNMYRNVSGVTSQEYIYWSSPVDAFGVSNISPGATDVYKWIPTVAGNGIGNYGEWQSTIETMNIGEGYIVRDLPAGSAIFTGVPNNGQITRAITRGVYLGGDYTGPGDTDVTAQDDNWNLVGNPYPSAISANRFTNDNSTINGTIYLWPHSATPSNAIADPFYDDFVYNYDVNNYVEHNNTGSNPPGTNDLYIGSGQSFFVLMLDNASTNEVVTFNNNMRSNTYSNGNFYNPMDTSSREDETEEFVERNRIWLDLISSNNTAVTTLIGYVDNATNGHDRLYDGYEFSGSSFSFYSIQDETNYSIQGRGLPFNAEDKIPLGIVIPNSNNYQIGINKVDGLFENQNIYLEDLYLNKIHDLNASPYSFTSVDGEFNDRFVLRYTNETLGEEDISLENFKIYQNNNKSQLTILNPNNLDFTEVSIYDILGRQILNEKGLFTQSEHYFSTRNFSDGSYIATITLSNNKQIKKKIIIKNK